MIQKEYRMRQSDEKTIEKVILDEHLNFLHMIFPMGEGLPIHPSNANLYMTVIRGTLSLGLNDQPIQEYTAGHVVNIPMKTTMNVRNLHQPVLELIVIKTPTPEKSCV